MENNQELTGEQMTILEELREKKKKAKVKLIVPRKAVLVEGKEMYLEFIEVRERVGNNNQPFKSYVFKDSVIGDYISLTGSALDQMEWNEGSVYFVIYNGLTETKDGHPFKSYFVQELPK